jgi:hypothetical protein
MFELPGECCVYRKRRYRSMADRSEASLILPLRLTTPGGTSSVLSPRHQIAFTGMCTTRTITCFIFRYRMM